MNPHADKPISLLSLWRSMITNKTLIYQMSKREILGRYKGSGLGILWSLITPILMLSVYTFVFSSVFKARWAVTQSNESKSDFALILFVGLIVYGLFSDAINRSSTLILNNTNYVTKVIFHLKH